MSGTQDTLGHHNHLSPFTQRRRLASSTRRSVAPAFHNVPRLDPGPQDPQDPRTQDRTRTSSPVPSPIFTGRSFGGSCPRSGMRPCNSSSAPERTAGKGLRPVDGRCTLSPRRPVVAPRHSCHPVHPRVVSQAACPRSTLRKWCELPEPVPPDRTGPIDDPWMHHMHPAIEGTVGSARSPGRRRVCPGLLGAHVATRLGCWMAVILGLAGCARCPEPAGPSIHPETSPAPPGAAPFDVRSAPPAVQPPAIGDGKVHPMPDTQPAPDPGTCHLLVRLAPGTAARELAERHDLTWVRTLRSDADMHVLAAPSEEAARQVLSRLQSDPAVRSAYLDVRMPHLPRPTRTDSPP